MTIKLHYLPVLFFCALLTSQGYAKTGIQPPATPVDKTVTRYFGVKVADPYRWLENADAPEVKAWINAQNKYTETLLGHFPQGNILNKRVQELALTSTQRHTPELVHGRLFFLQQTPPQQQAVLVWQKWPKGKPLTLVDPNTGGGHTAITNYWPSPNGLYVAYGTATGGNEATTIHVVEVSSGKKLVDSLPHAGGGTTPQALTWDADGKGFIYVRLPLPGTVKADALQFYAALYHHRLGQPAKDDKLVFGQKISPVAEYSFASSSDAKRTAIMVHFGDGNPDRLYLRIRKRWQRVLGADANVRNGLNNAVAWMGDHLLVIANRNAPRGELLSVAPNGTSHVLVEQGESAMFAVSPVKNGFLITRVKGPDWRIDQYDATGKRIRSVPLPPSDIGIHDIASSEDSDSALIDWSGWIMPTQWSRYDTRTGKLENVFAVKPVADYSQIRSYRFDAVSTDGTRIPVTVLAMAGVTPNAKRPTILYGYGGYGITVAPHFLGTNMAWLERGGIYAVANIRGGGEFGEGWHEAGMLGKKQNGFDDFYAAAQALIRHHWTSKAHLGILGGSNGGLLMGAELTQHPGEFRAVVSLVGIYDMLRAELWPNGRYNISEYGTVTRKPDFKWLYAYSPLHGVKKGADYPATLLITGVNDPRVAPWQSRKFAAALQAANRSNRPILLLTRMNEGHGVTASFSQRVGNRAAALIFFAAELGLGEDVSK